MKKIKIKKLITLPVITLFFLLAFFGPVQAQTPEILAVNFQNGNGKPLFNEASFLPGDAVTRWVDVKNNSTQKQAVVARIQGVSDNYGLADWMKIEIDDDNNIATPPFYSASLSQFFALPNYHLGDILAGESARYYFSITLSLDTPDAMQEKGILFDLTVAEGALESFGSERDSGSNSGGSIFTYNGLIISNVQVVTGNDSVTITWTTNKNATSRLVYDTSSHANLDGALPPNYGYANSTALFDSPATTNGVINHTINLTGLAPATTYYFRPISSASPEKAGAELSFTTGSKETLSPLLKIEKTKLDNGSYSLTVKNSGQSVAKDVRLENSLTAGSVFSGTANEKKSWQLGDIAPGGFKTVAYAIDNKNSVAGESNEKVQVLAYNHEPIDQSFAIANNPQFWQNFHISSNFLVIFSILILIMAILTFFSFIYRRI